MVGRGGKTIDPGWDSRMSFLRYHQHSLPMNKLHPLELFPLLPKRVVLAALQGPSQAAAGLACFSPQQRAHREGTHLKGILLSYLQIETSPPCQ